MTRTRSLSGIKSTGYPHMGNVLGMIQPAIDLQTQHQAFYFVADFHALTSVRDPALMLESTHIITAYFLAFGLDIEHAAFFRQSAIPEVTELTWMLSCVTHMGMLERAHSYKAARDKGEEKSMNHGVFSYPVLMAADILIYDSDVVPVGRDQMQHVEMARDMATRFNQAYGGDYLKLPETIVKEEVQTIPGVDGRKMSKSYGNVIQPLLAPKKLRKQIMTIETGSTPMTEPMPTDDCTVIALYSLFASPDEVAQMRQDYALPTFGYGHAKQALYLKMEEAFAPARERYQDLITRPDDLEDVLAQGAARVRPVVDQVMGRVREAVGIARR